MLTTVYEVKIGTFYKSLNFLMQHAWVALHIACHVQFSMTSSVTLVTPYITIVFNFIFQFNTKQTALKLQLDKS